VPLTGQETHLLCDEIGFEPSDLEEFIAAAIEDPKQWTDPAYELETMAKAAKGLLALWRAEREPAQPEEPSDA
jgi:hypothetical protein